MTILNPYLSFLDNARTAMEFYQGVFGGELEMNVFGEFPDMLQDPSQGDLIMHAQLTLPDGSVLMASDTPPGMMPFAQPAGFSISISGDDEAEITRYWEALSDGGTTVMPFEIPPWGGRFGMLVDRFGISWSVSWNG